MTRRHGLVWPILLIAIGAVFLLANLGYMRFSLVTLISLWPLVLILIGIDIAIGRRWPLAALGIDIAIIAAGIALVAVQPVYPQWFVFGGATSNGPGQTHVSAPRGAARSLAFRLNGGAGRFTVSGGASDLVEVTSDQDDLSLRTSGTDRVDVRVDRSDSAVRFGPNAPAQVDARLASDVPTSLDLDAGAGEFTVDLSDVKITDARINVGAASLRLVLPKPSGDVAISVSAGASSVVIEVPNGVEARVSTSGALIAVHSENPRIARTETSGYASANDRVTVRVTAGASSIVIR